MGKYDSYIAKKILFLRLHYYLLLWSIHRTSDDEDEMDYLSERSDSETDR